MLNQKFTQRFSELASGLSHMQFTARGSMSGSYVADGQWRKWATSVQSLLAAVFGVGAPHVKNFNVLYDKCHGADHDVKALDAVFRSAKEDFEGGYVFNVELRVSGEVFGDFITLAQQSLSEGHKDVAAVLSCAALEDALKRYAAVSGLDTTDKSMTEIINALKSNGLGPVIN